MSFKEELDGTQWYWDEAEQCPMLDEHKKIHITLRDAYFVEKLSVVSGYESADDAVGKLFFSKQLFRGGTAPYFLILKNGRIWFLTKTEIPKEQYSEVVRKILTNPDIIRIFDKVRLVKTAADLVLS